VAEELETNILAGKPHHIHIIAQSSRCAIDLAPTACWSKIVATLIQKRELLGSRDVCRRGRACWERARHLTEPTWSKPGAHDGTKRLKRDSSRAISRDRHARRPENPRYSRPLRSPRYQHCDCRGRGRRQLRPRHAYQRIDRVAPERRSSSRTAQVNSPNRRLEATSHGPPAASVQEWLNHCWAQRWTEKLGVPSNFLNSLSFRFSF